MPDEVAGPRDGVRAPGHVPRRVRGARLPHRLRPGRVPRDGRGVRRAAARRAGGRLAPARADLHPGDQGRGGRARRERDPRRGGGAHRPRGRRGAARPHPRASTAARTRSRAARASCWPTPSSSSAATPRAAIVLADEVLTPDSSRFWPADTWEPGHAQPSFDKQFVRDWLTSPASGWDRNGDTPPPAVAGRRGRQDPAALPRGVRPAGGLASHSWSRVRANGGLEWPGRGHLCPISASGHVECCFP